MESAASSKHFDTFSCMENDANGSTIDVSNLTGATN